MRKTDGSLAARFITRATKYRDRHFHENLRPMPPARQLLEIIRTDHPYEMSGWKADAQGMQGIDRILCIEVFLDIAHNDFWMTRDFLGAGHALGQRRHAFHWLQGILRANQPPDLIEPHALQRIQAHRQMPLMRGIKRPAHQADAQIGKSRTGTWIKRDHRPNLIPHFGEMIKLQEMYPQRYGK